MKLDANWKVQSTPDLITMLHDITRLHFKDFKRALYGEGNYRLCGKYKKFAITRNAWKSLDEAERQKMFTDFVKNKRCVKEERKDFVVSTYCDFKVPALNVAKRPGQKSRLRKTKTKSLKREQRNMSSI